ncbi:MAG: hypothetical protein ACM3PF_05655 [Bacteroidota bacterium]
MRGHWLPALAVASSLIAPFGGVRAEAPADSTRRILLERGDSLQASEVPLGWGEPQPRYRPVRFRGGDRSRCDWYFLTELGILYQFEPDVGRGRGLKSIGVVDLGMMKNVSRRSAVGVSGFSETGADYDHQGLRLRYRRWLAGPLCAELSPGIVLNGDNSFDAPGFIGQATINAGDLVSLVAEGEVARYSYEATGSTPQRHSTKTRFRVGVRGGSYVTVVTTAVGFIAFALSMASHPDLGF